MIRSAWLDVRWYDAALIIAWLVSVPIWIKVWRSRKRKQRAERQRTIDRAHRYRIVNSTEIHSHPHQSLRASDYMETKPKRRIGPFRF